MQQNDLQQNSQFQNKTVTSTEAIVNDLNSYIIKIQSQINKTFGRLYRGSFKTGPYNNNGLIEKLKYCASFLKYRPSINISQEEYQKDREAVVRDTIEYCISYASNCSTKANSLDANKFKKIINYATNYSSDDLYELSRLVTKCWRNLQAKFFNTAQQVNK